MAQWGGARSGSTTQAPWAKFSLCDRMHHFKTDTSLPGPGPSSAYHDRPGMQLTTVGDGRGPRATAAVKAAHQM